VGGITNFSNGYGSANGSDLHIFIANGTVPNGVNPGKA